MQKVVSWRAHTLAALGKVIMLHDSQVDLTSPRWMIPKLLFLIFFGLNSACESDPSIKNPPRGSTKPAPAPNSDEGAPQNTSSTSTTNPINSINNPSSGSSSPNLSQGSGGALGLNENQFAASNGKQGKFKLDVPQSNSAQKSHGLLVYLHGDGGGDYTSVFKGLKTVADKYELIPISVRSPTTNQNGVTWWVDADKNAVFLDELLKKEVLAKYNINKHRVVFTGISGGPTFMSGPWLRHYASQYRGGAISFCGGLVNTQTPFKDEEGFKSNFPIYFYIGDRDFLLSGAKSAVTYYQKQGMTVEAEYPSGIGHCQFMNKLPTLIDERLQKIFKGSSVYPLTADID